MGSRLRREGAGEVREGPAPRPARRQVQGRFGRRRLLFIPVLAAAACYAPVLGHGLVWDDISLLRDQPMYHDASRIVEALKSPVLGHTAYFRPLAVLTFLAELRLGGGSPFPSHLTNVLLHAINTGLVTVLASYLARRRSGAHEGERAWLPPLLAGLIYGLHPVLIESVAFISCRFDLLATAFLLGALVADVRPERSRTLQPLAIGLAFFAAAMSKEMAAALIFVLPLWHLARRSGGRERALAGDATRPASPGARELTAYAALAAAGALYLVLRHGAFGHLRFTSSLSDKVPAGSSLQHLLLVARSLAEYIMLVVWPFTTVSPLHATALPVAPTDAVAWASLAGILAVGTAIAWLVRRAPRAGWLVLGGVLALLPVLNLVPLALAGNTFAADRFLAFPLALLVLALAPALGKLAGRAAAPARGAGMQRAPASLAWTALAVWLVASVVTIERTLPNWRDDPSFWTWAARRAPGSATAHLMLGNVLVARGDLAAAEAEFRRACALHPAKVHLYWSNLAGVLGRQGKLEEAEGVLLREVLPRDPWLPDGREDLGILYLQTGRPEEAVPHLEALLKIVPEVERAHAESLLALAHTEVGDSLFDRRDYAGAMSAFERALGLLPESTIHWSKLASVLIERGEYEGAERALLDHVLACDPDSAQRAQADSLLARARAHARRSLAR